MLSFSVPASVSVIHILLAREIGASPAFVLRSVTLQEGNDLNRSSIGFVLFPSSHNKQPNWQVLPASSRPNQRSVARLVPPHPRLRTLALSRHRSPARLCQSPNRNEPDIEIHAIGRNVEANQTAAAISESQDQHYGESASRIQRAVTQHPIRPPIRSDRESAPPDTIAP